ncbi:hypothetical protein BGZ65_002577 [Modicella reniformis]|uniref:Uncharacterized protein n=1 Tax=Modicella reniformis TaxID=1440133 RepID=A0A9P6M9J3_9FUNG|nr:hypothetical protein BGZ65_002577 [Modicella reniformis]
MNVTITHAITNIRKITIMFLFAELGLPPTSFPSPHQLAARVATKIGSMYPGNKNSKVLSESTPPTPFFSATSQITVDTTVNNPASHDVNHAVDPMDEDAPIIFTPKPTRSQSSTPGWFTHYSPTTPSTTSTFTACSRASGATSPRTFMLQGFLARHSNGHIMYPKPTKCSTECSYSRQSSGSDIESSSISLASEDDDDDKFDERFLLLAQSPNPSEFEFNEFLTAERQKNAGKHQADSPVFFNGFPLLQMTRMDR